MVLFCINSIASIRSPTPLLYLSPDLLLQSVSDGLTNRTNGKIALKWPCTNTQGKSSFGDNRSPKRGDLLSKSTFKETNYKEIKGSSEFCTVLYIIYKYSYKFANLVWVIKYVFVCK